MTGRLEHRFSTGTGPGLYKCSVRRGKVILSTFLALTLLCGCGAGDEKLRENGSTIHSSRDGRYYWFYHAWKGHYRIKVAWSKSPTGPWTQHADPLLEPDAASFDNKSVACPAVIEENDAFYMLYSGENKADDSWSIGLAVSHHPLGPWRKIGQLIPRFGYVTNVSHHDGQYFMYAQSNGQNDYGPTVVATALDLKGPWTIEGVALPDSDNQWENAGTEAGTVLRINNNFVLLYAGGHYVDDIRMHAHDAVGVAFSSDGFHFTRSLANPIINDPRISIGNVSAVMEGRKIYLFYTRRVNDKTGATETLGQTVLNLSDIPAH